MSESEIVHDGREGGNVKIRSIVFVGSLSASAILLGGIHMSCGTVQPACADSCPMNVDETLMALETRLDEAETRLGSVETQLASIGTSGAVPAGAVMFFNLATCPQGWSPLAAAEGRYLVGVPASGLLAASVGTALGDQENRAVGQHGHAVSDPGHSHGIQRNATQAAAGGSGGIYGLQVNSGSTISTTQGSGTGITIGDAGSVAGTNAPYVQYRVCQKD